MSCVQAIILQKRNGKQCVILLRIYQLLLRLPIKAHDHSTYTDVEKFNQKLVSDLTEKK